MHRRNLILALAGLPFARTAAARGEPYRLSLISGEPDGEAFMAAVVVDLDGGWKTYWRMPGESGIPPVFDWSNSVNVKTTELRYPVPMRYQDQSGETIGFKHRAVFPVRVTAADPSLPARLDLGLFLGICKEVCIPARRRLALDLAFSSPDPSAQTLISEWLARVPVAGTDLVRSATVDNSTLRLRLAEAFDDVFVETTTAAYIRAPQFSADRREAGLAIDGLANPSVLKSTQLKITLRRGNRGFEQTVTAH